jgi:Ni,Fe-hydrogenase I small subunit
MTENFGENYKKIILSSITKSSFTKSIIMRLLVLENYFNKIFTNFSLQLYKNSEVVITRTDIKKKIIVVVEGNIQNSKTLEIVTSRGEVFGEQSLKINEKYK